MDLHQFLIVAFKNEKDAVAILPETYLNNNELCFWPPYTSQGRVNKAIKECEAPNENWPKHAIRVIKKIGSYNKAQCQLEKATITSDLQSDSESSTRLRPKRAVLYPDEHSETESFVEEPIPISKKVKLLTPAPVTPKIFPSGTSMQLTPSKPVSAQMLTPLLSFTPPAIKSKINLINEEQRSQEMLPLAVTNKIVSILVELKEDVANLRKEVAYNTAMLQNIANGGIHEDDQNIFDILKLPLCNMAQLLQLEKTLENEKMTMKKLIQAVASKGGQNLKEAVKRMLLSLLHNDVLKKLNWAGQGDKDKQSFRDLNCRLVVEGGSTKMLVRRIVGANKHLKAH
ncbi:uncharacterized protein LOC136085962 isoform X3 [Hydra vulgaris]|uniref:Uncharacterized protein LOC136085962 isoform X3 n=1 Tax=Hydra vulgaris TaxID=6087 RepID=A0ABM4CQD5_HYDVU